MFWGCAIKPGKEHQIPESVTDVLRISNLALNPNTKGTSSLFLRNGGENPILVATLTSGKTEHVMVDIYVKISVGVTLSVKGNAEIHVSGYYDPTHSDLEDIDEMDEFTALNNQRKKLETELAQEEEDEEEEVEEQEDEEEDELDDEDLQPSQPVKKLKTQQGEKKVNVVKAKAPAPVVEEEEDEEEEEIEDEEGDLAGLDDEDLDGFTAEELAELENMDPEELEALEREIAEEEQALLGKRAAPEKEQQPVKEKKQNEVIFLINKIIV